MYGLGGYYAPVRWYIYGYVSVQKCSTMRLRLFGTTCTCYASYWPRLMWNSRWLYIINHYFEAVDGSTHSNPVKVGLCTITKRQANRSLLTCCLSRSDRAHERGIQTHADPIERLSLTPMLTLIGSYNPNRIGPNDHNKIWGWKEAGPYLQRWFHFN